MKIDWNDKDGLSVKIAGSEGRAGATAEDSHWETLEAYLAIAHLEVIFHGLVDSVPQDADRSGITAQVVTKVSGNFLSDLSGLAAKICRDTPENADDKYKELLLAVTEAMNHSMEDSYPSKLMGRFGKDINGNDIEE